MAIVIEKVKTNSQLADFINLPFSIHKNNSQWVPNLKNQDRHLLNPQKHPFWQTATRELFIAKKDGIPAGRIAAIIDHKYNDYSGLQCGAFGFFETQDDAACANALFDAARNWLASQSMTFMRGPLNPSTNYSCGLLVDGFEYPPTLMMPWNPPYYAELVEKWHFHKEQDLFAYIIERDDIHLPDWLSQEIERARAEKRFTYRTSSKATLKSDIQAMLRIYQESWAKNWGFSPLSDAEAAEHVRELTTILDPEFFVLFFRGDEPAAGMVALPNINPLLKRLNGKLGILTPWHYWRSRKEISQGYRIMLFGILPQYRLYGLPLLLFDYLLKKAATKRDFRWMEGSWVLEDNIAIDSLIEDFSGKLRKRYRIYRREIAPC